MSLFKCLIIITPSQTIDPHTILCQMSKLWNKDQAANGLTIDSSWFSNCHGWQVFNCSVRNGRGHLSSTLSQYLFHCLTSIHLFPSCCWPPAAQAQCQHYIGQVLEVSSSVLTQISLAIIFSTVDQSQTVVKYIGLGSKNLLFLWTL